MTNNLLKEHESMRDFYNITAVKKRLESDDPVRGALELAYFDTQRTLRGIGKNPNRKEIKQQLFEIVLRWYLDVVEHFEHYSLRDFDGTFMLRCNEIIECGKQGNHVIHFGQAQKIVNMFFKYMLLVDERLNLHLNYFHVPLDSVMLKGIIKNFKDNAELVLCAKQCMPWSKMEMPLGNGCEDNFYMRLQDELRKVYENPIIFEFEVWNKWKLKLQG